MDNKALQSDVNELTKAVSDFNELLRVFTQKHAEHVDIGAFVEVEAGIPQRLLVTVRSVYARIGFLD